MLGLHQTGCSAAWLARSVRDAEAPGSNPGTPTTLTWANERIAVPAWSDHRAAFARDDTSGERNWLRNYSSVGDESKDALVAGLRQNRATQIQRRSDAERGRRYRLLHDTRYASTADAIARPASNTSSVVFISKRGIPHHDRTIATRHCCAMAKQSSAQIISRQPLLRAGLARLANDAGICIVEDRTSADLVLHVSDQTVHRANCEVVIGVGYLVIECQGRPEPAVWESIRELISHADFE